MYEDPTGDLAFGDVFSADWLFDAYLRQDAIPLVAFQPPKLGGTAWRRAAAAADRDLVLGHGQQRRAVLLSDDCEAITMMRRGGRSRLIFAALERLPTAPAERDRVLKTRAFRRFPLPPDGSFEGGIVELQHLFAVAATAIDLDNDPRVMRLAEPVRRDLEVRWDAYATRRGPLSHLDNAEKLARVLSAGDNRKRLERLKLAQELPGEADVAVAAATARALSAAWEIEGAGLNQVADIHEAGGSSETALDQLEADLKRLAAEAQKAAALLANARSSTGSK